ncbi:MAG TPA: efflux RND transporter periplasmic adaptor subunit [Reyranella sp.]|jgi:membrane fusion protein, multidrug efflux system|nr:efflux RND transporter periplasmic adaptor subunit [Reyranella sp.]
MNDDVKTQTANRPRVHLVRWIVASAVLLLVAFFVWQKVAPKPRTRAAAPQIVTVAQATLGDMPVILNELGTVTPTATVTVMPNQSVSGYLTEVPFQEGQDVEQGQVLAQIDPRPYQAALDQAIGTLQRDQGILHEAQMDLDRFQKLVKLDSIARQQAEDQAYVVVQNEGTVKLDQAAVDTAKLNLAYARITSPVAGRVGLRLVDPGNYISGSSSTGVAVVTTIKPTTVVFTVAQNDLRQVVERFRTPGVKLPVTAYSSDGSKKLATGTLYAINNQMAASTGTVTLRASFANDDEALFPNEFVNVRLLVDTLHQAVLVPNAAVLSGAPGSYVYLVNKDDTASVHKVTLGPSDGKNTVIASGLAAGDTVVIDGTDRLSDGAKIKVAPPPAPAAAQQVSQTPASPPSAKKKTDGSTPPSKNP